MKSQTLRKKSNEKLLKMLKDLKLSQTKASSVWGRDKLDKHKAGIGGKGQSKQGSKTSIQRDIRRTIARIKTILKERENDNNTG